MKTNTTIHGTFYSDTIVVRPMHATRMTAWLDTWSNDATIVPNDVTFEWHTHEQSLGADETEETEITVTFFKDSLTTAEQMACYLENTEKSGNHFSTWHELNKDNQYVFGVAMEVMAHAALLPYFKDATNVDCGFWENENCSRPPARSDWYYNNCL